MQNGFDNQIVVEPVARLIEEFGRLTGVPVLLNTSYNRREPIVASPADAVACYLQSGMDALAIGDFLAVGRKP